MSYIINKTNGTKLVTVEDGSINVTACDLTLVGKNYAGYGETIATNFIKLLENFSNSTQPTRPITGQIWYDSANKKIKFYNGSAFKGLPTIESSSSKPADLLKGDLWYNETEGKLYFYDGSGYVMIGPQVTAKAALNAMVPVLLKNSSANSSYNVLVHQIQDEDNLKITTPVAITSNEEFVPGSELYSSYFPIIKKGITLSNADAATGVSSTSTNAGYMIWGTAADSIRLAGRLESEYVRYANPLFTSLVQITSQNGLNIASDELKLYSNVNGAQITTKKPRISLSATSGGILYNIVNVDASDGLAFLPSRTPGEVVNIGSNDNPFYTIYSRYQQTVSADLAEKYSSDADYEPGTVLKIGGTAEVTICNSYECESVAGVVTTDPAYLMNSALKGGVAIALKGRIPCKVKGPVKKGDILVSSNIPGHAEARRYGNRSNLMAVIGKALQDFDGELGIIEIKV
jgi:hypothetical protein